MKGKVQGAVASTRGRTAHIAEIAQGLRRIVKALHAYSQEVRSAYGLTGPQLWALKTLQRNGSMSVGRLAQHLAVHQSSLSILLDRLAGRGLVRRVRGRPDRRVVQVQLTPRGRATVADAPDAAQGRLLHALSTMSLAELEDIRSVVDRLVAAMEAGDMTARFFFSDE